MAVRHFELVEGSSAKFWEIWIDVTLVLTRYGRLGAAGQTTEKDEGSAARATQLRDKLVAEKTRKGYVESGKKRAAAAPPAGKPARQAAAKAARPGEHDAAIARIEKKAAKAGVALNPGAGAAAIDAAEMALGRTLPGEVRAFYRRHDGAEGVYVVEGRDLLSLKEMVSQWKIWRDLLEKGTFGDNDHSDPEPGVQQRWWIREWVPITHNGGGDHHVLDLAPGKGGTYGQILSFYHDEGSREVVGKSFLGWLEKATWGSEDEG